MAKKSIHSQHLQPTGPVLVGFSGGLDSTVLLHSLCAQASVRERGLRAIHVQHDLHPQAAAWSEHCREVCAAFGTQVIVAEVKVNKASGMGVEAAAREVRYRAFAEHLQVGEVLALAHHRDDQAETVLLRLLRASGSEGLAAMRELRPFATGTLWRPLLTTAREDLLAYAQANDLRWIEDPSNSDQDFDRNFLRHRILPILRERWPHADASLARSAALLAEDASLLQEGAIERLSQVRGPNPSTLVVSALLAFERPWRARVLREWLAGLQLPSLPGSAFASIESDLFDSRPDAVAEYRWAGFVLRRWRDWLHVEAQRGALPADWSRGWDGRGSLQLPSGDSLKFSSTRPLPASSASDTDAVEKNFGKLMVRARHGGERITLPSRAHSHSLKQLLQETGMPPWIRRQLPLLFAEDGSLLAAGEQITSARLEQFCREQFLRLHWTQAATATEI